MILDYAMGMMEKVVQEIREAEPEKRNHFVNSAVALLEASTEALRESPEFRRAFAMVHSEFLKYPECSETLEQGRRAYGDFMDQSGIN